MNREMLLEILLSKEGRQLMVEHPLLSIVLHGTNNLDGLLTVHRFMFILNNAMVHLPTGTMADTKVDQRDCRRCAWRSPENCRICAQESKGGDITQEINMRQIGNNDKGVINDR